MFEPCTRCGGYDHTAARPRAFDSSVDLLAASGNPKPMPNIELPNGKQADPTFPLWRASICEPVDRVTLLLAATASTSKLQAPNGMLVELRTGLECAEEFAASTVIWPTTYDDAGLIFSWWSPVLFSSVVLTGTTIGAAKGDALQSISTRMFLDRACMCCPDAPTLGPLSKPRQP